MRLCPSEWYQFVKKWTLAHGLYLVGGPPLPNNNTRWRTAAILYFWQNLITQPLVEMKFNRNINSHHPNTAIWQNCHRPPFWKYINFHNSAALLDIFTKFGRTWMRVGCDFRLHQILQWLIFAQNFAQGLACPTNKFAIKIYLPGTTNARLSRRRFAIQLNAIIHVNSCLKFGLWTKYNTLESGNSYT